MWLAAACLLALLGAARAQQPTQCSVELYGTTYAIAVPLPEVRLGAGDAEFAVRVPVNVCSPYSRQVGTRMQVCDFDVQPFIQFSSAFTFYVRRYSDLTRVALLRTTVFCLPDMGPHPGLKS